MKKTIMSFLFSVLLIFSVGLTASADPPQDTETTTSQILELETDGMAIDYNSQVVMETNTVHEMDSFIYAAEPAINFEQLPLSNVDNYLDNIASVNSNQLEPRYGFIPVGKMQCYYVKLE